MANTSYLKKVVEPYLLQWTAKKTGVLLAPRRLVVGQNSEGSDVSFAFDGVSPDGSVGVCISASSSCKTGQMRKYFLEATLLCRCTQLKRRIMVFTNEVCWEGFRRQCDGLVDLCSIEPLVCADLPTEMREKIRAIYVAAAAEVGDKSGPGQKLPGARR